MRRTEARTAAESGSAGWGLPVEFIELVGAGKGDVEGTPAELAQAAGALEEGEGFGIHRHRAHPGQLVYLGHDGGRIPKREQVVEAADFGKCGPQRPLPGSTVSRHHRKGEARPHVVLGAGVGVQRRSGQGRGGQHQGQD